MRSRRSGSCPGTSASVDQSPILHVRRESRSNAPAATNVTNASCRSSIADEHDLAGHAALSEELLRFPRRRQRQPSRDQGLDLALAQEFEQGDQVLSEQSRSHALQPLDAVGNHTPPTRKQPASRDVQAEDRDAAKPVTSAGTTRSQPPTPQRSGKTIGDDRAAGAKRIA